MAWRGWTWGIASRAMKKMLVLVLLVAALLFFSATASVAQDASAGGPQLGSAPPSPVQEASPAGLQLKSDSPSHAFGRKGQAAIMSDFSLGFDYDRSDGTGNVPVQTTKEIYFDPALMYFVVDNLAVGGSVDFRQAWAGSTSTTHAGIGPRVGYNVNLGPYVSVLPRIGISYDHSWETVSVARGVPVVPESNGNSSGYFVYLNFDAYFLLHPVQHFLFGLGPTVSWDPVAKQSGADVSRTLQVGVNFIMGGWVQLHRPQNGTIN